MKKEKKMFVCSKFGHDFKIIIQGTTTTAILFDSADVYIDEPYIGVAELKGADVYDYRIGILVAMKTAMSKLHSHQASVLKRQCIGFQSNMRNFNAALTNEINQRRQANGI